MPRVRYTGGGGYRIRDGPEFVDAGDEADVDEATAERLTDRPDFTFVASGGDDTDASVEASDGDGGAAEEESDAVADGADGDVNAEDTSEESGADADDDVESDDSEGDAYDGTPRFHPGEHTVPELEERLAEGEFTTVELVDMKALEDEGKDRTTAKDIIQDAIDAQEG